jgi:hypothetical protein
MMNRQVSLLFGSFGHGGLLMFTGGILENVKSLSPACLFGRAGD